MTILGIETSCDETSVAILEEKNHKPILLANIIASSFAMHIKTGGIIPENAAREQIKFIIPCLKEALEKAEKKIEDIDTIAVTFGPGLIGSLLVGVETAKTLSFVTHKPLVPVNHMVGHIYANWLMPDADIQFPALALVVSGGHTDLLLMKKHGDFQLLGGTRDDAAGEAFDKIARLLGFAYPGGPVIEKRAKLGNPKRFIFPRPLVGSGDYDFSFSGLKTAVFREVTRLRHPERLKGVEGSFLDETTINDICAGVQKAISSVLIKKSLKAANEYQVKSLLLSGGVAANQTLREAFQQTIIDQNLPLTFFAPSKELCTDNATMIAAAAFYNNHPRSWQEITADPELYFD